MTPAVLCEQQIGGSAEAVTGPKPCIRINPEHIFAWGLADIDHGRRRARSVGPT